MALTDLITQETTAEEARKVLERLSAQMQVNQQLSGATSLDELLWRGAEIRALVDAERLFLYAIVGDELITRVSSEGGSGTSFRVSRAGKSIPAFVASSGEEVNLANVAGLAEVSTPGMDIRYDGLRFQAIHGPDPRQLLCVPMIYQGRVLGVMEAVNKISGEAFDAMDVECLREAACSLAPMLHKVNLLELQSKQLTYTEQLGRIINSIHNARDVDQILLSVWKDALGLFDVRRITIYAVDEDAGELYSKVKQEDEVREIRVAIDHNSIAGYCAATRSLVNVDDVYDEAELSAIHHDLSFNRSYDQQSGMRTRQVVAAPLIYEGELHGVLQLINTRSGEPFDERTLEATARISGALAAALAHRSGQVRPSDRTRFDRLVKQRLLSLTQLTDAKELARERGEHVEEVLMAEYGLSKQQILDSYAAWARREAIEFDPAIEPPALLLAPVRDQYDRLKSEGWCPVRQEEGRITIAMTNPRDVVKVDEIQGLFPGQRLTCRIAIAPDVVEMIDHCFGISHGTAPAPEESTAHVPVPTDDQPEAPVLAPSSERVAEIRGEIQAISGTESDEHGAELVKLVNLIVEHAYHCNASDIHIEPYPDSDVIIRQRVDGELQTVMQLDRKLRNALVSRVKIMSDLDIAERRRPQDGKIKFRNWGKLDIELRVATLPTAGGCEDVVMRILAASRPMPLDHIGMSERNRTEFVRIVEAPYGIILCVGPTGSGKTTTLHSALGHINREGTKIWTAEDPVEITQAGLRQVQVNEKAGLSFAAAMRSFLRADPDVIMVGEMRDKETAGMGIEASLTGHLVLSTLHTNNAPETVTRLMNIGVDVFAFGDALLGILAQRLTRTLCMQCREAYHPTREELDELRREYASDTYWEQLGVTHTPDLQLMRPRAGGCAACHGTGYQGRMGLHELLVRSDEMRNLIYERAQAHRIRELAMEQGMRTLKQDGIEKILQGHTDLRQVRRVCT